MVFPLEDLVYYAGTNLYFEFFSNSAVVKCMGVPRTQFTVQSSFH